MKSKPRTLFAILFGVPLLLLLPLSMVGSSLFQAGDIEVSVQEKHGHGGSIGATIPASIVPVALWLTPASVRHDIGDEIRDGLGEHLELVESALRELSRCPDGVLVEVRDAREFVVVEKRNGRLEVHVDSPDEAVHVAVPMSTVRSVFGAI